MLSSGASGGRQANNVPASDDKVIAPYISARIEQCHHSARVRIDARKIRSLVRVAAVTGESESAGIVGAAVLLRNDMLDMERDQQRRLLRQVAVFTRVASPPFRFPPVDLGPC